MAEKSTEPTKMADAVAKSVLAALEPRFEQIDARFDQIEAKLVEHDGRFDSVDEALKAHTDELEAIRNVVDRELASQGQVDALEGHVKDAVRSSRQNGKQIEKVISRLDKAKIPA